MAKKRGYTLCRCGAKILFMKTLTQKYMPVEYTDFIADETIFDSQRMKPHWAVCPLSAKYRRDD